MTKRPEDIIKAIVAMLTFFEARCANNAGLRKLILMFEDRSRWTEARALFSEIRQRTLAAEKVGDELALAQCLFEEICAKTLYNLASPPAPYDPDSPFWILPLAVTLGRQLGVTNMAEISALLSAD